jgi:protocatechuate 3,4-dioxygenase beta subunit/uncharacterized GH25 family protein
VAAIAVGGVALWLARDRAAPDATGRPPAGAAGAGRPARLAPDPYEDPRPATAVVEGVVLREGTPVPEADVVLVRARPADASRFAPLDPTASIRSDAQGRFRFAALAAGRYALTAAAAGVGTGHAGPIEVRPGDAVRVDVQLSAGAVTVRGRVLDTSGGVVPGARVRATALEAWSQGPGDTPPRLYEGRGEAEGRFALALAPGRYLLRAEADGYTEAQDVVNVSRDTEIDLRLAPAARVAGRVIEARTRRPVPDAEVWLVADREGVPLPRDVRTDEAGAFSFGSVHAGTFQVGARKGNLVGVGRQLSIGAARHVGDVEVIVEAGVVVSGRVVTAEGRAVAGARVEAFKEEPPFDRIAWALADGDGRYRLEGLLPGRFVLAASAERHAPTRRNVVVAADADGVDLTLPDGARVDGTVLGADGRPVAGARVSLVIRGRPMSGFGVGRTAVSDAAGRFTFEALPAGQLDVQAEHAEAGIVTHGPAALAAGETKTVSLTLATAASIDGVVRFDDGRPAAGVRVRGAPRVPGASQPLTVTTGEDGTFHLAPLKAGQFMVAASRSGEPAVTDSEDRPDLKIVSLAAGEGRTGLSLVLPSAGRVIAGRITDAAGKPAAGASLAAAPDMGPGQAYLARTSTVRTLADQDGAFLFEDLAAGVYTLNATHPVHPALERRGVQAGTQGLELRFTVAGRIAGVAVSPEGRPLDDYTVTVLRRAEGQDAERGGQFDRWFDHPTQRVRGPDATFAFEGLHAGAYEVRVTTHLGRIGAQPLTLAAGEAKTGLRVRVDDGIKIRGRLVEFKGGTPVPGVEVSVDLPGGTHRTATSDAQGAFVLDGLGPAPTVLVTFDGNPRTHVADFRELELANEQRDVDLGNVKLVAGDFDAKMAMLETQGRGSLGISATNRAGRAVVTSVEAALPGGKAGVKAGDLLLAIDGQDVRDLGWRGIWYHLTGRAGTEVSLDLESTGSGPRRVVLTRAQRNR